MKIETTRLIITEFTPEMAEDVHLNSLDEDNRRFVPDEVFETVETAKETVEYFMSRYHSDEGPFVYPVLTKDGQNIGYVQLVNIPGGWEIGYHIAKKYAGNGYATEAVQAFLPYITAEKNLEQVFGICLEENAASLRVMEKCGFENLLAGEGVYRGETRRIVKKVWKNKRRNTL